MSGRKSTPDVLGDVLGKARRSNSRPDSEEVKRHDVTPSKVAEKPFKLTSYIEAGLNDEADMAVLTLKKRVGKGKLTKSMLVEESLRICLADPVGSGLESALRERSSK